jgi:hypothetical protein
LGNPNPLITLLCLLSVPFAFAFPLLLQRQKALEKHRKIKGLHPKGKSKGQLKKVL